MELERRVDPDDGVAYTCQEFNAYYAATYKKAVIDAYWQSCKVVSVQGRPAKKAKAKATVKGVKNGLRSLQNTCKSDLTFWVNSQQRSLTSVDPEMTVLEYLRMEGLTGTKLVCGEGGCGACSVLVTCREWSPMHRTINSCLATIGEMDGCHITTPEGLCRHSREGLVLHPVQEALSVSHGSQCGFCTPGMVMAMYGLLKTNSEPTVKDVEECFDGNLCRCTGYRPILQAFQPFGKDFAQFIGKVLPDNGVHSHGDSCENGFSKGTSDNSAKWAKELERDLDKIITQLPETSKPLYLKGSHLGKPCDWYRPTSLKDTLLIREYVGPHRLQVGNTERRIEHFFKHWTHQYPMSLVSLTKVPELLGIHWSERSVTIGAAEPLQNIHAAFEARAHEWHQEPRSRSLTAVVAILRWFAGHAVRNAGCLGGNVCTASPISDLNPCHIATGAVFHVASLKAGKVVHETLDPKKFWLSYRKTALQEDQLLVDVEIPLTKEHEYFQAYKQARRRDDDLAIVNAAMRVRFEAGAPVVEDACFAFGGMASVTRWASDLSAFWIGKEWSQKNFQASLSVLRTEIVDPLPLDAPGGMVQFRKTVAQSFYFKFFGYVCHELHTSRGLVSPIKDSQLSAMIHHSTHDFQWDTPAKGLQHFERDQKSYRQAVGAPNRHKAADQQVAGLAEYTDDMPQSHGEVFMNFVLSPHARAKVLKIDPSAAKEIEGFVDIITWRDVTGATHIGPIKHDEVVFPEESAEDLPDRRNEVQHVGHVVAAVVAMNRPAARAAAKAVKVEYQVLDAVTSLMQAVREESLHELMFAGGTESCMHTIRDDAANMDELLAKYAQNADMQIVSGESFMGGQEHFYLEPQASRCEYREDDELLLHSSCQNAHETQVLVAEACDIPQSKVNVRVKRMGGAFGGKESRACVFGVYAALGARKLRRSVRFVLDRDVDFLISGKRHEFFCKYTIAVHKKTLMIEAIDASLYANAGWSMDLSEPVLGRAMFHIENACKAKNTRVRGHLAKTNHESNTAFRGFGGPQGMYFAETMYDHAASDLGILREELVRPNLYKDNEETHFHHPVGVSPLERMWKQMMTQGEVEKRRTEIDKFNNENRYRKRGLSLLPTKFGISFTATHMNQAGALVHLLKDGSIQVYHGGHEMGQGLHTKMCAIAAEMFDVPIDVVHVNETCTDKVANTLPTAASAGTDLNGAAVKAACETLLERLQPFLTKHRETMPQTDKERTTSLANAIRDAWLKRENLSANGFYKTPIEGVNWRNKGVNEFKGEPFFYYSYGAALTEVEIDCLTGDHAVLRADVCHDVGKSINPAIDIGQIEGAFVQGMGLFTTEELLYDEKTGRLMTVGPGMYKMPGFASIPRDFRVSLLADSEDSPAVRGSKAVGEPPLFLAFSTMLAIKEAVRAARRHYTQETGIQVPLTFRFDAPATAEKIRLACPDELNPLAQQD